MFRMWCKLFDDRGHLIKDTVIKNADSDLNRTRKIFAAIHDACYEFDLAEPIWLDSNVSEFQRHSKVRFTKDNFVEDIEFAYMEIEVIEEWVEQREEMNDGLDAFIVLTQKYVDVEELTQTIVNEYIKKIVVYAPDKSSGKRTQKVKIYFNFVDDVDIPIIFEPITTETTYRPRRTA